MQSHQRRLLLNTIPVLLTVAVLGYLAGAMTAPSSSSPGRSRAGAAQVERTLAVSSPVVLAYPAAYGWQARGGAPRIPGLSIAQPLLLAPGGADASTGLIAGKLAEGGPGPLPAQFLARLPRAPIGEVVDLMNSQAYRYPHVSPLGFDRNLTLYAIPNSMGTTLVACYAPTAVRRRGGFADVRTDRGQAHAAGRSSELRAADPRRRLRPPHRRCHRARRRGAPRAAPGDAPSASLASLSTLSARVAAGLAGSAESLSTLQPPPAAGWAHTALSTALWRTRDAYSALAAAAHAGTPARYAAARTLVDEAEANLSSALRSFALIGYT